MKISELIAKLEKAKAECGDRPVWIYTESWDAYVDPECVSPSRNGKAVTILSS